ncbi:potassium/proton antiporter [Salsipaludibacter albus]|uniref:potassium/proton antiporter n=1 Tax=Salsipaludibacter albus TaxID=2849650 RepID=UPI001EE3FC86|nr:potassium/proton antiporter [Salsipaludibacter albus]MBY5161811.1 potassium/proton antiporter [Salsipaludibacter albus]
MAGPFTTLFAAMRRGSPPPGPPRRPLWVLLRDEAAHAVRRVLTPASLLAAVVAGVSVFVVLGPATPGPVLGQAWRPVLATVLALVAAAFAHFLLARPGRDQRRSTTVAIVAATALVVAGTVVLANLLDLVTSAFPAPPGGGPTLDASLSIDPAIAIGGILLVVAIVSSAAGRRLGVPTSLLFLGLGVLAGPGGFGWVDVGGAATTRNLAVVALVAILFDGGVTTTVSDLRRAAAPGAVLATVGVMATAAITAGIVVLVVPGTDARTAWLVGAVVASTDAAALGNLLRNVRLPHRVHALLTVESGGNDPIAILLTVGILASWDTPVAAGDWVSFALWQLVGGLVAGIVVGTIASRLMGRLALPGMALYPVLALAMGGAAYGLAAVLGASGLLAAYACGVVIAATDVRHRRAVRRFSEGISTAVEIGLFLLLGLQVVPAGLVEVAVPGLLIALGLLLVARPIAVGASLAGFRMPIREVGVVAWLGVRGAVPIVLATYAATAGVPGAQDILHLAFFVVAVSLVVHGVTAQRVVDAAGLPADPDLPPEVAMLVGDLDGVDLLEAELTATSPLVGERLADRPPVRGVRVLLVTRGDVTHAADGDTTFRVGDRLVLSATDRRGGLDAVRRWLGAPPASSTTDLDRR